MPYFLQYLVWLLALSYHSLMPHILMEINQSSFLFYYCSQLNELRGEGGAAYLNVDCRYGHDWHCKMYTLHFVRTPHHQLCYIFGT